MDKNKCPFFKNLWDFWKKLSSTEFRKIRKIIKNGEIYGIFVENTKYTYNIYKKII